MNSEWGHGDDDEMARLLKGALRREADRVEVPDRYEAVRQAAQGTQRRRTPWLAAVAAVVVVILGAGVVWQSGLFRGGVTSAAAPAATAADRAEQNQAQPPPAARTGGSAAASPTSQVSGPSGGTMAPVTRTVTAPTIAFGSPSGNLVCYLASGETTCQLLSASLWELAAPRACPVVGGGTMPFAYDKGGIAVTAKGAGLYCGGQALVMADLAQKDPATAWYQAGRDTTVTTVYGTVPVLPYGGVASTPGGQRCVMAEAGVLCTDPAGSAAFVSREQLSLARPDRTFTRFVTVSQLSAFITPSGGIVCAVDQVSASCEVKEPSYSPPPKPASCQLEWAGRISVGASTTGFLCVGDSMFDLPAVGTPPAGWFDPALGTTVPLPSGRPGAVLGYGSTLSAGSYTCEVAQSGVTCTDKAGRGFVIAKGSYRYLP